MPKQLRASTAIFTSMNTFGYMVFRPYRKLPLVWPCTNAGVKRISLRHLQKATKLLIQNFPEIEKIVNKIGSAEIPTDPMPIEAADMMVILKDKSEWTSAKTFNELSLKMTKVLEAVPGITVGFQFPVQIPVRAHPCC